MKRTSYSALGNFIGQISIDDFWVLISRSFVLFSRLLRKPRVEGKTEARKELGHQGLVRMLLEFKGKSGGTKRRNL